MSDSPQPTAPDPATVPDSGNAPAFGKCPDPRQGPDSGHVPDSGDRSRATAAGFDYWVRVQPADTDYSGVVWHGSYVAWMEAARVEALRARGLAYDALVAAGCELPVVELSIRYRRPARLGDAIAVRARLAAVERVRLVWDYAIESPDGAIGYATAKVVLVPVDSARGKIVRAWPSPLREAIDRWETAVAAP